MNGKSLGGLIALNVVMLVALALFCFMPQPAQGQFAGIRGGDYVMIASAPPGRQAYKAVIITDLNKGVMLALRYDVTRKNIKIIGFREISRDATSTNPQGTRGR